MNETHQTTTYTGHPVGPVDRFFHLRSVSFVLAIINLALLGLGWWILFLLSFLGCSETMSSQEALYINYCHGGMSQAPMWMQISLILIGSFECLITKRYKRMLLFDLAAVLLLTFYYLVLVLLDQLL